MSWVTIAVFAILILFGVSGWRKGIIRTAVSLAAMVVTFIVCVWVTPSLCKNVKENTQVYDNLQKSIYNFIIEDENFNKAAGESLSDEEAVIISISQLEEYAGQIQKNVNDIMKKLNQEKAKWKDDPNKVAIDKENLKLKKKELENKEW